MQQRRRLVGEDLLRLVDLGAVERLQPGDLVERQLRIELQEAADVVVLDVTPELPVVVGREHIGVEPDRALRCLAHLGARRCGEQRAGERIELWQPHAAAKVDAVDDVAPLVGAADLQTAVAAARKLGEVVGLEHHVVELEKGELVRAVEPELDGIHRQHAVDREIAPDVAQEVDVVEWCQPLGIVDHDGRIWPAVEIDEAREGLLQALLVGLDLVVGEQHAQLVLARRIADTRRAAAHQSDRPVAGLLEPAQHHDREQIADVIAFCRAVVADIGGDHAGGERRVEPFGIGALIQESARFHDAHEVGAEGGHACGQIAERGRVERS